VSENTSEQHIVLGARVLLRAVDYCCRRAGGGLIHCACTRYCDIVESYRRMLVMEGMVVSLGVV
jgi:hypothetical protein